MTPLVTYMRLSQGSNPTDQTVLVPGLQTQNIFDSKTRPRAVLPVTTELRVKCKLWEIVVEDIFDSMPVDLTRTNKIRLRTGFEFRKEESRYVPWSHRGRVSSQKPQNRRWGLPPPFSLLQDLGATERDLRCRSRLCIPCKWPCHRRPHHRSAEEPQARTAPE